MSANDENLQQRWAELLALADRDAPKPDEAMLARLREQSSGAFASAAEEASRSDGQSAPHPAIPRRRSRMFLFAVRAAAAAVAASILAALALLNGPGDDKALALDRAIEKTAGAETLHLQLTQDGKTREVFARRPQQMRIAGAEGQYRIVRGPRMWVVDEPANRASLKPAAYFADDKSPLDLVALLDLPCKVDRKSLAEAKPAEEVRRDAARYYVYRFAWPCDGGQVHLEALVDAGTQFLHTLEAKREQDGRTQPLSKLEVVSLNQPVDESLFVVGDTLTEDGRIGKVADLQGIVSVKPATGSRWTPIDSPVLVYPKDWVQTDVRGANAVRIRLVKDTLVTLGPGTVAEVVSPKEIRIASGEIKIVAGKQSPVEVTGPDGTKQTVAGTQFFLVQDDKLQQPKKEPLWLAYFEGRTANDSIGSLVAKVEGRDVPLTVGYHKVTVDVRDQIARTTIEESFVNNTAGRLEGTFYFPLPADASISGFGMWIGNDLIEADIVEKQRAREIYETILRENRDPGLLEWTGGNIFKARVFPIEAHSEKRIKITYTQVLPLKGNSFRYQYALQSEMLKQHPLRELSIDVKIYSAVPLAEVTSPTHLARIDKTANSARVEFSAQEYTPTKDFEVLVQLDGRQSEVVMIPHRRGDDGYFMLQLMPPGADGGWRRELLPDGEPQEILILADTSASMDADARAAQQQFIGSLLAGLTPNDKFNLAVCDVDAFWAFTELRPAEKKNVAEARRTLAERHSLGWTDLDKAFASAMAKAGANTRVIYVGDGIITTGDGDAVAFSKRLKKSYEGKQGTYYAVAVGSSYEQIVLKTIASLGGGSIRQVRGDQGPQTVARELLEEMVQPSIRDLKVEFRGLRTARVYPEELPNLPPGSQQILLGRYLPEGKDQEGEVVVTGMRNGQPVRFATKVSLKDAEEGNSFIPRLWARMHLDFLLQQGSSQAIQDEIIALSEEYNIITPYTSMLVLETDADRERFKVKTRFRMRDGEKFFAEGRDNVNYELAQQQMRRAATWRIALRRAVLQQLQALGRNPQVFAGQPYSNRRGVLTRRMSGPMSGSGSYYGYLGKKTSEWYAREESDKSYDEYGAFGSSSTMGGMGGVGGGGFGGELGMQDSTLFDLDGAEMANWDFSVGFKRDGGEMAKQQLGDFEDATPAASTPSVVNGPALSLSSELEEVYDAELPAAGEPLYAADAVAGGQIALRSNLERRKDIGGEFLRYFDLKQERWNVNGQMPASKPMGFGAYGYAGRGVYRPIQPTGQWLNTLFPLLPPVPEKEQELKRRWPADAQKISESLLRLDHLTGIAEGLRIEQASESFDPRWGELTSRSENATIVRPKAWAVRSQSDSGQTIVQWCDAQQRGILGQAFQLGRVRGSKPADLQRPPLNLDGFTIASLERTYNQYRVEVKPQGDDRVLLVLTLPAQTQEVHILVDTVRAAIVWIEHRNEGKTTYAQRFSEFVEIDGRWYANRIETFNDENQRTGVSTQKFQKLAAGRFDAQWKELLAGKDQTLLLNEPLPTLEEAQKALADKKAKFEDHLRMMLHFEQIQQWDEVMKHLDAAGDLSKRPGFRWIQSETLKLARRREEWRQRVLEEAARLANPPDARPGVSDRLFLSEYLLNDAAQGSHYDGGGRFEQNELLQLLDKLRPVFEQQPKHVHGMKRWTERRAGWLEQTGQWEQSLALRKQLADQYPHDSESQRQYAQSLVNVGEYEAAEAWIRRVIAPEARWQQHEEDSLRSVLVELMRQQGRYEELANYLADWIKQNPQSDTPYRQYLSSLIYSDQMEKAYALMDEWINAAQESLKRQGKLSQQEQSRLRAAVYQAQGQGYYLSTDRIDERWHKPLADLAMFLLEQDKHLEIADQIMTQWRFAQTDAARDIRKQAAKLLRQKIATLSPDQIQRIVNWIISNDPAVEVEAWRQIADGLRKRWNEAEKPEQKHQLGATLSSVLQSRLGVDEWLAFLRVQLKEGPKQYHASYAQQLFNAILARPWKTEYEREAFGLLLELSDAEEEEVRIAAAIEAVHRMTDQLVQARFNAAWGAVQEKEKLTRPELAQKQAELLKQAREGFADALRESMKTAPAELAKWMNAERLYLDVLAGRNLDKVAEECWEFLGADPAKLDDFGHLENRYLTTLMNLAARKGAKQGLVGRVLAYLDSAIEKQPDVVGWKLAKVQLLVALDRPKDLQQVLRGWIQAGDPTHVWRQALGYLLAEQGQIKEAILLFEELRKQSVLGPTDLRALANWYMAVDRRADYSQAMIEVYKFVEDWRLNQFLSGKLNSWRRSDQPMPSELDQEVLLAFTALFEKSSNPQSYLWQLREFYEATRDFRLLAVLADGVIGHTAGQVYPMLQNMNSVFSAIQDEATVDSVVEKVAEVRKRAKTPVDQRALDLLLVQVERRAAELKNQPGPHAQRALDALKRAFLREWSEGEPRLMADFLASLGNISHPELAAEQVRQLEALYRDAQRGSIDRLHIAHALAQAHAYYSRRPQAIDLLALALDEYQAASGGALPQAANNVVNTFIGFLEAERHYARGERYLQDQLKHPANRQVRNWLTQRLYQLYQNAISNDGSVSLGSGATMYQTVQRQLRGEIDQPADDSHRYQLVNRLLQIYRTANEKKLRSVQDDLKVFAFLHVPQILKRQTNYYDNIVSETAQCLHDLVSPREGLAMLVERIENEPKWFKLNNQGGWNRYGHQLSHWRSEGGVSGELEERLLRIVLRELRADLSTRQSHNRQMYHNDHSYFWAEKADAFAQTAEEVLKENKDSSPTVLYIADYLYHGLERQGRAIEILLDAHRREVLAEDGQSRLVQFLHWQNRHGESIPILEPLVARRPDNMQYRVWLMHAYFRTGQQPKLLSLLNETDAYFHKDGRWTEGNLAALAASCLENQLYQRSIDYYKELIPLHQRTQPNRGIGNGTLSQYYANLAQAYSGLGKTIEAVEAAGGAIVSWGPRRDQRQHALNNLKSILQSAKDIDAYVRHLDKQAEETGLENPIVRKAAGQVYLDRKQYEQAAAQLKLALAAQPNDVETHKALIDAYGKLNNSAAAIDQVLALLQLTPRDVELYKDLAARFESQQKPDQAERARTSIVEVLPSESESHQALAEIRQSQNRWDDAIEQWGQVARIRALEPTGLLKLAEAQIAAKRWDDARQTLDRLAARSWPSRFGDVPSQVRQLQNRLDQRK